MPSHARAAPKEDGQNQADMATLPDFWCRCSREVAVMHRPRHWARRPLQLPPAAKSVSGVPSSVDWRRAAHRSRPRCWPNPERTSPRSSARRLRPAVWSGQSRPRARNCNGLAQFFVSCCPTIFSVQVSAMEYRERPRTPIRYSELAGSGRYRENQCAARAVKPSPPVSPRAPSPSGLPLDRTSWPECAETPADRRRFRETDYAGNSH